MSTINPPASSRDTTGQTRTQPTEPERAAAAAMLPMIWGMHISRAIYVAAELRIADLLADGPVSSTELARTTRTHEPSLYRVLRLLAALGVLDTVEPRAFGLTALGDRLRSDAPACGRGLSSSRHSAASVPSSTSFTRSGPASQDSTPRWE